MANAGLLEVTFGNEIAYMDGKKAGFFVIAADAVMNTFEKGNGLCRC